VIERIRNHPAISEAHRHLILDDKISELMVNGSDSLFIEKDDFQVLDRP